MFLGLPRSSKSYTDFDFEVGSGRFSIERSHNTHVDVTFDGELIPDTFMKFKDGFNYPKEQKTMKDFENPNIF